MNNVNVARKNSTCGSKTRTWGWGKINLWLTCGLLFLNPRFTFWLTILGVFGMVKSEETSEGKFAGRF
jgi:hypothetical protein